jgi:hypothetical protein
MSAVDENFLDSVHLEDRWGGFDIKHRFLVLLTCRFPPIMTQKVGVQDFLLSFWYDVCNSKYTNMKVMTCRLLKTRRLTSVALSALEYF